MWLRVRLRSIVSIKERLIKGKRERAIKAFEKLISLEMEIDISSWSEEKRRCLNGD